MTPVLDRALAIPGWMRESELFWLALQASKHKLIVEVGSYMGRSTRALADNTRGTVYAVDDFIGPRDVIIAREDRNKIFESFVRNMDGLQGRLNVVRCDHGKVIFDASPDMVFLDGDHTLEAVARDIDFWSKRLAPGGLLCGHDYAVSKPAVDKKFPNARVASHTDIWFVEFASDPFKKYSA